MKKLIISFHNADEYKSFYKRYTDKGVVVSVAMGMSLTLSIDLAQKNIGNYLIDIISTAECEQEYQDSLIDKDKFTGKYKNESK